MTLGDGIMCERPVSVSALFNQTALRGPKECNTLSRRLVCVHIYLQYKCIDITKLYYKVTASPKLQLTNWACFHRAQHLWPLNRKQH